MAKVHYFDGTRESGGYTITRTLCKTYPGGHYSLLTSKFEDEITCKRCIKELKMKTNKIFETYVEKADFTNLLFVDPGPDDDGFFATKNADTLKEASDYFGVSGELLKAIEEAIKFGMEELIEKTKKDLIDIWKQVEKMKEAND